MIEEQRKKINVKVEQQKSAMKEIERINEELLDLENNNEAVKKYIELTKRLNLGKQKVSPYAKNAQEIVKVVYAGSITSNNCEDRICVHLPCLATRKTNSYRCLECGRIIQATDTKKFEQTHVVLKINNLDQLNFHELQTLYYLYLYENPVEEATQKLIRKFNEKQ